MAVDIRITYNDVAPYAADDATYTSTGAESFSDFDLNAPASRVPIASLEDDLWLLDGTYDVLEDDDTVPFWSSSLSNASGSFSTAPKITISFSGYHSSVGLTLIFDPATGNYCSEVGIVWKRDGSTIESGTFYPDGTTYFCNQPVDLFDSIEITLTKTSVGYRRARVNQIVFGMIHDMGAESLEEVTATSELSLLSLELPYSQLTFGIRTDEDVTFMFQNRQPVELYKDGLIGVYYFSRYQRKKAGLYTVTAYDALGVLAEQQWQGQAYLSGVSAKTLLENIVDGQFPIEYATDVVDATLTGVLLDQSRRDAIQQVLFAWGVCLTCRAGRIQIFNPPATGAKEIGEAGTFIDGVINEALPITAVNVVAHTYTQSSSGVIQIGGDRYNESKTIYTVTNPLTLVGSKPNVKSIENATLVSTDNGQAIAQRVFEYLMRLRSLDTSILYDGEGLADLLTIPAPSGEEITGNIEKMTLHFSGITVAQVRLTEEAEA